MPAMKTSAQQFEMLVTYMEQHGDLSKLSSYAKGRINRIRDWEELTSLLNSDGSGDKKTTEKWKKVWSDFKGNTKKKAARLHKAATGTGGGPADFSKLTDLEQRVLNLIGEIIATGLPIDELGPENVQNVHEDRTESEAATVTSQSLLGQWDQPGPSYQVHVPPPTTHHTPPTHLHVEEIVIESNEDSQLQPGPGVQPALIGQTPPPRRNIMVSPRRNIMVTPRRNIMVSPRGNMVSPRINIMVSPRRRTTEPTRRRNVSPRRRVISPRRPPVARADEAAQQFVQSDVEWRHFRIEQHRQEVELRREGNRIREMEVETQRGWQTVASRALDLLEKVVSKYCGDSI